MTPFRSTTTTALVSTLLATTLAGCQFGGQEQDTSPIVIAADLELSGAAAGVGKAYRQALELKRQQLNASGALNGRTIELLVKDNRSDASESLRNIADFSNDSRVTAIIMGGCNECAVGAARTVDEKQIPTVALAAASAVTSPVSERRYMFKLAPNAADNAAALTVELRRRNIDTVGLLRSDNAYGVEGSTALAREFAKVGIQVLAEASVRGTDTELDRQATTLTAAGPDALVIWTPPEQAMLATSAVKRIGFDGALFLDASAAGDLFLGSAARAAERATLVFTQTMVIDDVIATTPAKAARRQWFQDYTARFGGYHGSASFAADAVQLIADAELRAGGPAGQVDRDALRDVLETSQMDGLSGPIRMTPDNHSGLMPQALTTLVARNGRWRLQG
ncbi:branched-chain amino acid transport system substrate-binding protein [Micromonospora phaseoli]|uniref:Branched-chain amino acid transport system substrate-binding protein n=1 Tax=Micromonospora phaseoli TaxID=1144548 RepID=A0A1H6X1Q8_9ACTN|nr:ABC transporter substrate-binding protein [Micromonospora phaseoli]PZW02052.1 amino acid/amide ABC transporter substrate-binding protein (HAAT family) [Micromonospora phaseoli]GIJ80459.1 branched-chain amino acid ABC transporter [Micromonospora phaseoli]SEJ23071.1 branched-chain amino acid transport system substrate-binding protein [Micromonospora phaseoli]